MNDNWTKVIAEPPFDQMGAEFSVIFSDWLKAHSLGSCNGQGFDELVFDLFQERLALAERHKTWFATQMANDVWKNRYNGLGFDPCYSFAIEGLERTKRFFTWSLQYFGDRLPESYRVWDTDFAPLPHLPVEAGEANTFRPMEVFESVYRPQFAASKAGALKMRTIRYNQKTFLFEHVRNNWVPLMREEAKRWWAIALIENDVEALAAFEWLWVRVNPFGRSAALGADAMSLLVQKFHGMKMRDSFYHQDQEALLLPFHFYCLKRANDLRTGFNPMFQM